MEGDEGRSAGIASFAARDSLFHHSAASDSRRRAMISRCQLAACPAVSLLFWLIVAYFFSQPLSLILNPWLILLLAYCTVHPLAVFEPAPEIESSGVCASP